MSTFMNTPSWWIRNRWDNNITPACMYALEQQYAFWPAESCDDQQMNHCIRCNRNDIRMFEFKLLHWNARGEYSERIV